MLGWEFPPLINGGLGVACAGLTRALADHADLTLILPETGQLHPYQNSYSGDFDTRVNDFTQMALEKSKDYKFDIIHVHDWMTFRAGLEIKSLTNKPLVLHIHSLSYDRAGPEVHDLIFGLEQRAMTLADRVITVSKYTKSISVSHYGINPDKIHPIHNGVNPVNPVNPTRSQPDRLVTFLGRMTRQKAPLNFLEIAAKVLEDIPSAHFVMAGTGDQLEEVVQESIRLNILDQIQFPGFINRNQINALFARTSVYCMPSISEPFGLSALEAAQFGIPIVISKQSGVAEVLPRSRTADHWDLDLMASHVIELLRNKEAHTKASEHSSQDHRPYTWSRSAIEVSHLYNSLRPETSHTKD